MSDNYTVHEDGSPSEFNPVKKFKKEPVKVSLKEDAKYICMCGQSDNFPYCDGSHKKYNLITGNHFAPKNMSNPMKKYGSANADIHLIIQLVLVRIIAYLLLFLIPLTFLVPLLLFFSVFSLIKLILLPNKHPYFSLSFPRTNKR